MAGGTNLAEEVKRLLPQTRGKSRLDPAPSRDAIAESRSEAVPSSEDAASGMGWVSPINEQAYAGSTFYHHTDSSGLFMVEFGHTVTLIDDNGNGDTYIINLDDPNTP